MFKSHTHGARRFAAIAAVSALAVVGASCSDDDSAGPEVSTDVEDIVEESEELGEEDELVDEEPIVEDEIGEDPMSSLVGQMVAVSGDVDTIDDPTAFEISSPEGNLLVISATGLPDDAESGTLVQVTGTVREVLEASFDDDFGFAYDPGLYGGYEKRLALAADEVVVLDGDEEDGGVPADNVELDALNDSDVDGDVAVVVDGTQLTVTLSAENVTADLAHAMHLHFELGQPSECPDIDGFDVDDNDILTTAEGVPAYGPVQIALTTEGDFSPESGLAVERFPVADADGFLTYERTFDITQEQADLLAGMQVAVVLHGQDIDESGAYDGDAVSSLDETLPLEATIPVACGIATL